MPVITTYYLLPSVIRMMAWSQKIHAVPKSLVINRDFNLHIPAKGELKVDLENTGKKKNNGHQGQDKKKNSNNKMKGSEAEQED
ncbi:hypothetical protein Ddc_18196 [Ditylenchus destructor]|nr:hypothetical protein Ddc_18196 [Ditylenchus destructor]